MEEQAKTEPPKRPILPPGTHIGSFEITKHLGSGGYGDCYEVIDKSHRNNPKWAIKLEYKSSERFYLEAESLIMQKYQDSEYFPILRDEGETDEFRYLVMELFGPSLSTARRAVHHKRYTAYTVLRSSLEMLNCIYEFHKKGFTHRDIKPANFLIRADRRHPIVLIDYGLAIPYRTNEGHIPPRADAGFTGTCRYASLHTHQGLELSRRDDLISWFYSVVELANGSLPWPGSQDRKKTAELKRTMTSHQLCANLPVEFITIYEYLLKIKFSETPNYGYISKLIIKAMKRGAFDTTTLDWENIPEDKMKTITTIDFHANLTEKTPLLYEKDCPVIRETGCSCCNVA